jgi:hypothetical protein
MSCRRRDCVVINFHVIMCFARVLSEILSTSHWRGIKGMDVLM